MTLCQMARRGLRVSGVSVRSKFYRACASSAIRRRPQRNRLHIIRYPPSPSIGRGSVERGNGPLPSISGNAAGEARIGPTAVPRTCSVESVRHGCYETIPLILSVMELRWPRSAGARDAPTSAATSTARGRDGHRQGSRCGPDHGTQYPRPPVSKGRHGSRP